MTDKETLALAARAVEENARLLGEVDKWKKLYKGLYDEALVLYEALEQIGWTEPLNINEAIEIAQLTIEESDLEERRMNVESPL